MVHIPSTSLCAKKERAPGRCFASSIPLVQAFLLTWPCAGNGKGKDS